MERRSNATEYQTDGNTLTGYAAVWDTPTTIRGEGRSYTEIVRRGAFGDLAARDVIVTFNHDPGRLLGRTSSGTAQVAVDERGLRFSVTLPDYETGLRELVKRGDVRGASFAFKTTSDRWNSTRSVRELTGVNLIECGPVVMPAYQETSVSLRSGLAVAKARLFLWSCE